MAKRRLVEPAPATSHPSRANSTGQLLSGLAIGFAGAIGVYVAYFPSDSVSVENGDALWFAVLSLLWLSIVAASHGGKHPWDRLDVAACGLAAWMMVAAFLNQGHSDLRMGTNEAWWWVSAMAVFLAGRRTFWSSSVRSAFISIAICVSIGLAVDAGYQQYVSLPATQASYQQDPDKAIAQMGIDAPAGSAARMVLENRLFDGGPTATFALANSLAAILVLGIVLIVGLLKLGWPCLSRATKSGLFFGLLVVVPALFAVRSRAALVATLAGILLLTLVPNSSGSQRSLMTPRRWVGGVAMLAGLAMVALLGLAKFGDPEWFAAAPASLTFRLQYWSATWRMMGQHPWLGAGPGNFQAIYDRFRSDDMIESIADPHNFLLETLSSGGPLALGLLFLVFFGTAWATRFRWSTATTEHPISEDLHGTAIISGGGVMLVAVWFFGFLTRHSPDLDAHRFAVPIALGLGWWIHRAAAKLNAKQLDWLFGIACAAILLHLSVSGGWTVPGIAFWVWMLIAGLARHDEQPNAMPQRSLGFVAASLSVLVLLILISVRPVTQRKAGIAFASDAIRKGNSTRAIRMIDEAVNADPWALDAAMMKTEFLYRAVIRQKDRAAARGAYQRSVDDVTQRMPPSPPIQQQWASHHLHLYQVFGKINDLNDAKALLQAARNNSPADQWIVAQLAEVHAAENDLSTAKQLARTAKTLSQQGANLERALYLQWIFKLQPVSSPPLGVAAAAGPVREPAESVLQDRGLLMTDK